MHILKILKKCIAVFVVLSIILTNICVFDTYAEEKVAYVKATGVNIRTGPSTSYDIMGQLSVGDSILVNGESKDTSGKTWYSFSYKNNKGFIRSDFVNFPKEYVYDENFEYNLSMQNFPEDYKAYLRLLHAQYPLWEFEAFNTGFDFDYVVSMENEGTRSLVTTGAISSYKSTEDGKFDWNTSTWTTFDGKAWVCASKDLIRYYMDPRNFLIDPYVFQYEKQTFDDSIHTLQGVNEMVKGTFLDGNIVTSGAINTNINYNIDYNVDNNVNNIGPGQFVPSAVSPPTFNTPPIVVDSMPPIKQDVVREGENLKPSDNGPVDQYGNIIPILENDFDVINFSSTIYSPGVINVEAPSDEYEESSYPFVYLPQGEHTIAEVIFDACRQVGISPYVVISLILQEQGKDGKTDSVSGKKTNYNNIYNYGNIGAYASEGKSAVENGLIYASASGSYNRPWNSKEKALYGIVDYYAHSYIKRGQDTFYLKKWNVQGSNVFKHQYMTNVLGAASEGQILASAYDENLKNSKHVMKIPIYNNLPIQRCQKPVKDGNPNNKLKDLTVDSYVLTPTFDKDITNYTLIVPENVNTIKINATKINSKANVTGTGKVTLNTAITNVVVRVMAENGDIKEYVIMVFKPGAIDPNPIVEQIAAQESQMIITNANIQGDGGFVPSPPISNINNADTSNIIYGVLNQ